MFDCSNLTTEEYMRTVDFWYQESQKLPINRWNIFQPAKRWLYHGETISNSEIEVD